MSISDTRGCEENGTRDPFPGDTLGIIGGNPNGIMLARTAKKMGFTVVVYCSDESNPVLAEADVKWSVS